MSSSFSMNNEIDRKVKEGAPNTPESTELDVVTFRHRILQNPWELDADVSDFLENHPEQKGWVKQVREQDRAVRQALKQAQPPENLKDKILLQTLGEEGVNPRSMTLWGCVKGIGQIIAYRSRQTFGTMKRGLEALKERMSRRPVLFWSGMGLAMGVLSVALVLPLWHQTQGSASPVAMLHTDKISAVEQALIAHVEKYRALTEKHAPVSQQTLQAYLERIGAQMAEPMDFVTHVSECNINGMKGIHLVIQSFSGPVTVVVLPKVTVPQMVAFKRQIFHGELIPVEGATVAVLGKNMTQVGWAQMAFLNHVKFGTSKQVKAKS